MSELNDVSGSEGLKKIGSLIEGIDVAILVTAGGDGSFDSRLMAVKVQ